MELCLCDRPVPPVAPSTCVITRSKERELHVAKMSFGVPFGIEAGPNRA
jgi:hypothetical protein